MEHSNHSEHQQDGMGHDMHEGHRKTGPKDGDYTGHHAGMATDFRKRFWICLIVTAPVLALSHIIQEFLGLGERLPLHHDAGFREPDGRCPLEVGKDYQ